MRPHNMMRASLVWIAPGHRQAPWTTECHRSGEKHVGERRDDGTCGKFGTLRPIRGPKAAPGIIVIDFFATVVWK